MAGDDGYYDIMKDFANGEFLWHTFGHAMNIGGVCSDCAQYILQLSTNKEVRDAIQKHIKNRLGNDKMFELKFDTPPLLAYIQKEPCGMGELYLRGKRLCGLQEIEIKAETRDATRVPELKLKIVPEKLAEFGAREE